MAQNTGNKFTCRRVRASADLLQSLGLKKVKVAGVNIAVHMQVLNQYSQTKVNCSLHTVYYAIQIDMYLLIEYCDQPSATL